MFWFTVHVVAQSWRMLHHVAASMESCSSAPIRVEPSLVQRKKSSCAALMIVHHRALIVALAVLVVLSSPALDRAQIFSPQQRAGRVLWRSPVRKIASRPTVRREGAHAAIENDLRFDIFRSSAAVPLHSSLSSQVTPGRRNASEPMTVFLAQRSRDGRRVYPGR